MSRPVLTLLSALVALAPTTALAAAADCPDGWFCDEGAAAQPASPPNNPRPPLPAERPMAPPGGALPPRPGAPPGYNPPAYPPPGYPPLGYGEPTGEPGEPTGEPGEPIVFRDPDSDQEPPAPRRRRHYREWGFNLHLQDALLGDKSGKASNAGMAGLGVGLRYRPLPPLAFEAGLDLLTGTDFNGYDRTEVAFLVNTYVFFNPHDVVQFYVLGGLGISGANVTVAPRSGETPFSRHDEHYSYFGGQAGFGAEVRVSRRVAISGDIIGFVRGRTDDSSDSAPEFTDPNTNRATNTSGGGLLRLGATFYW